MKTRNRLSFALLAACAWVSTSGAIAAPPASSPSIERPRIFDMVEKEAELQIENRFETDFGLIGWAVRINGRPTILYTTQAGDYIMVGRVFDRQERDLTLAALRHYFPETAEAQSQASQASTPKPLTEADWERIESASWIAEGAATPEKIVYVFFDPYCQFCHRFWSQVKSYETRHGLQVRYLPVAILGPNSKRMAANLLASRTPIQALREWIRQGKPIQAETAPQHTAQVEHNTDLMLSLGFDGTPTIVWRDRDGIHYFVGMPSDQGELDTILLPKKTKKTANAKP